MFMQKYLPALFLSLAMAPFLSISNAAASSSGPTAELPDRKSENPIKTMSDATQFSLGLVGFAGNISAAEVAMRRIAKSENAETRFSAVLNDPDTTTEGKLYALCGLKLIESNHYSSAAQTLEKLGGKFSTMYGDTLKKEEITIGLERIDTSKCKEQK